MDKYDTLLGLIGMIIVMSIVSYIIIDSRIALIPSIIGYIMIFYTILKTHSDEMKKENESEYVIYNQ